MKKLVSIILAVLIIVNTGLAYSPFMLQNYLIKDS